MCIIHISNFSTLKNHKICYEQQIDLKLAGFIGASLSEPPLTWKTVWCTWSMCGEPQCKTVLRHITVVWYGGSCMYKQTR